MAENLKEKIDVYKIRIEELDRNYFSHRDLEWRITLQFLSGYIAVGLGYVTLRKDGPSEFLTWGSIGIEVLLYLTYLFYNVCHRQRLRYSRELKNTYVEKLHALADVPQEEAGKSYAPWFPHRYAFMTQLAVHSMVVASVIIYVFRMR